MLGYLSCLYWIEVLKLCLLLKVPLKKLEPWFVCSNEVVFYLWFMNHKSISWFHKPKIYIHKSFFIIF